MIESSTAPVRETTPDLRAQGLWKWLAVAIIPLALIYLSMLNRYWVPSGDGEVYTCIARSLVRGEGLMFNGSRAAIAPPGWPLVLALAMKISPEFAFLKLVTIFSMLGAFVSAFFVLRRFVTDRASAGIILLTGILSSVYPLTYWMHTEAFFCLLGFSAILIAFRIAEGKARLDFEVPIMLILLGFGAFTRWPGILHIVLIIPILLSGPGKPWKRVSIWAIAVLSVGVCVATFMSTHSYLSLTKEEKRLAIASGGTAESETETPVETQSLELETPTTGPTTTPVLNSNDSLTPGWRDLEGSSQRSRFEEYAYRVSTAGKWFAWLLWQPTRFGQSVTFINASALVAGWLAIAMLILALVRGVARHEFFWIGLAIYTGGLCVLWPNPNARYFVPVAPFIILGIFLGIQAVSEIVRRPRPILSKPSSHTGTFSGSKISSIHVRALAWPAKVLMISFVAATLLSNLPLLGIDIWVFRSHDFYARYEAGSNKDLIFAANSINQHPTAPERRVAVADWYDNMGRGRYSKYGQRALHLLTDRQVITPPKKAAYKDRPTQDPPRIWAKKVGNDADYYVWQSPWNPWRVWHFRLSPDLQAKLSGKPRLDKESGGWELYMRVNNRYQRAKLDRNPKHLPTRVPGL